MKQPLDSLFGRLVLTTVTLIVLVQATMVLLVERNRANDDTRHLSGAVQAIMLVRERDAPLAAEMAQKMGISFVDADRVPRAGIDTYRPLENHLRPFLPPGTHVAIDDDRTLWVHADGQPYTLRIPYARPSLTRFFAAAGIMLAFAIAAAVLVTWQIHRPIRELAEAARAYRLGGGLRQVKMRGPNEIRELIGDFNDMTGELAEAERERAEMLASIAHDLRTPLTRIQVRADLLDHSGSRGAFLRDTESMGRIITQFLSFAGTPATPSDTASVDMHCRRHYTDVLGGETGEGDAVPLVTLDLQAGSDFTLPAVDIDRIVSNLIENAMTYGEPPVEIATALQHGQYVLTVRDHGPGVPDAQLDRVMRPFVRLDAARGGNGHSGLGLAIVERLAQRIGGECEIANRVQGGLNVTLRFPFDTMPKLDAPQGATV